MSRLEGKVVVVTGAAGGIGKEVVRKLVIEGAKVTLVDVSSSYTIDGGLYNV